MKGKKYYLGLDKEENLKRSLLFGIVIIIIDQFLKWYFQTYFAGKRLLLYNNWGFTYMINYGLWINTNISKVLLAVIQILAVIFWVIVYFLVKYYHKYYRESLLIDLSFCFYSTATFGNIIDMLFLGYIRDYFINPIAISNLADISIIFTVLFFIMEMLLFKKSRQILKNFFPLSLYRKIINKRNFYNR